MVEKSPSYNAKIGGGNVGKQHDFNLDHELIPCMSSQIELKMLRLKYSPKILQDFLTFLISAITTN